MSSLPRISIIIPVYEDAERLGFCLAALNQQTYPRSQIEIIVIDNGSKSLDAVKDVVGRYQVDIFDVELKTGSYAARNRGIDLASGDLIAFTDSDCIPESDWLEQGASWMRRNSIDMATGYIEVFSESKQASNLIERFQMGTAFPQQRYMKQRRGGATANVLVHKYVIEAVGKFNDELKSGGDLEWGHRVFRAGFKQQYVPAMKIHHPARSSWESLKNKKIRTAGGSYDRLVLLEKSWWRRQAMFTFLVVTGFCSPRSAFVDAFMNPRVTGFRHGCEVFGVTLALQYLGTWEKVKIHFGRVSRRR